MALSGDKDQRKFLLYQNISLTKIQLQQAPCNNEDTFGFQYSGGNVLPEIVSISAQWSCCSFSDDTLSYTTIGVGDSFSRYYFDRSSFTTCAYVTSRIQQGERRKFVCTEPIWGRYVAMFHKSSKREYIVICELEVYTAVHVVSIQPREFLEGVKSHRIYEQLFEVPPFLALFLRHKKVLLRER